ncbi:MAG: CvpA family protein [Planctomycetaceae bacterium]|nr:CvpA family protein [Planctomycetaceae bacterium]
MVWYDFVILAILAYTAWQGAQKGLVTQLAWIAAIILCFKFADKLAPAIEGQINVEQPLRHWIAMFILYLGFSLGSFLAARVMNSWLEKAEFKDFDRHLGGVLGLVKGVAFSMVLTFFALTLSDTLKDVVLSSNSGRAACYILDTVKPITPEYFHEYLVKYEAELEGIQRGELGAEGSIVDFFKETQTGGQGGTIQFPSINDSIGGGTPASDSDVQGPEFHALWRNLPQAIRDQYGPQLQEKWSQTTPAERQQIVDRLGRSLGYDIPDIVGGFLSGSQATTDPRQAAEQSRQDQILQRIGEIYQNREMIVQRTKEHFVGLPSDVQRAVLEDWYADLNMQSDPDPATTVDTRLDERILRQLSRARISLRSLSSQLQNRLNESLR